MTPISVRFAANWDGGFLGVNRTRTPSRRPESLVTNNTTSPVSSTDQPRPAEVGPSPASCKVMPSDSVSLLIVNLSIGVVPWAVGTLATPSYVRPVKRAKPAARLARSVAARLRAPAEGEGRILRRYGRCDGLQVVLGDRLRLAVGDDDGVC